jgi:Mn2+/Fe2+ NRAMP family transporter
LTCLSIFTTKTYSMKKIIVLTMLLIVSAASFSQQIKPSPALTKQDYLQKSKHQKTTAVILTVACPVLILSPALIGANSSFSAVLSYSFTALGLLCLPASIPFFIASHRNKKKAMQLTFKNEMAPQFQNSSFTNRPVPSLSLKFSL